MRYLKIILLMGTLSIAFASFPKGTTVIGGWGTYSNGTIDSENFCDDCSYLELNPNISYFLRPNLSLDLYLNLKIWDGEDKEIGLEITESYYFYKKFYLRMGLDIGKYNKEFADPGLILGVGYPIALSRRVMFDINYNFIHNTDTEDLIHGFKYSFRVAL